MPVQQARGTSSAGEIAACGALAIQAARACSLAKDRAIGGVSALRLAVTRSAAHEGDAVAARAAGPAGRALCTGDGYLGSLAHLDSAARATGAAERAGADAAHQVAGLTNTAHAARSCVESAGIGAFDAGAPVRHWACVELVRSCIQRPAVYCVAVYCGVNAVLPCVALATARAARPPSGRCGARCSCRTAIVAVGGVVEQRRTAIQVDPDKTAANGAGQRRERQASAQSMAKGRNCFHLGSATRVTRARTGTRKLTSFASAGNCTRRPAFSRQAPRGDAPTAAGSTLT